MTSRPKCDQCELPATSHVTAIHNNVKFHLHFCDVHVQAEGRELIATSKNMSVLQKTVLDAPELVDLRQKFDQQLSAFVKSRLQQGDAG